MFPFFRNMSPSDEVGGIRRPGDEDDRCRQ
jgi:hypothetical protein